MEKRTKKKSKLAFFSYNRTSSFYAQPLGRASFSVESKEEEKEEGNTEPTQGKIKRASKSCTTLAYSEYPEYIKGLFSVTYRWFKLSLIHI